jgi:hypothetical protein
MAEKTITQKIEEHFAVEEGEWLFERGKVKEGKLIKEAYHMIKDLQRELAIAIRQNRKLAADSHSAAAKLAEREQNVENNEKLFQSRLNYLQEFIDYHKT